MCPVAWHVSLSFFYNWMIIVCGQCKEKVLYNIVRGGVNKGKCIKFAFKYSIVVKDWLNPTGTWPENYETFVGKQMGWRTCLVCLL